MKAFSLFSGIGGFDLALKRNGVEIVGACEIDKHARSVYGKHFPGVPIHENATTIEPKEIPDHSIFVAGFPCQAFSIAGQRRGFNDTRGTLFFEIQKIVEEKQPSILLLENVLGILSHNKGQTFATILDTLDALGYDVEWQVLNSKYFVPQNRERVFIVGHSRGKRARKIFPIGGDDKETNGSQNKMIKKIGGYSQCNSVYDTEDAVFPALSSGTHGYATGNIATTISSGQAHATVMIERSPALSCKHEQVILAWSKSTRDWGVESRIKVGEANTLNCGDGCRNQSTASFVLGDRRIRRLTPLECERLQGFPDNWTEGHADTQRYKMCGNAVTVPVVEYLVKELLR